MISRAASSPLKSGIEKSITATSGHCARASRSGLLSVGGFRDDGEAFPLQQRPQALPNDRVVIREENASRHVTPPRH